MTRRLNLDLDGVFFDFDGGFRQLFGRDHKGMADSVMWKTIFAHGTFFANLPLFPGAKEFFDEFAYLEPTILSAAPKTDYALIAGHKRAAVREHLSKTATISVINGGRNKALFMHAPGDVLVDDFEVNCESWDAAGGVAILHTDFETTAQQLRAIFPTGLDAPLPTALTPAQKLSCLAHRFYSQVPWSPEEGDTYTTSRDDLELYQIKRITDEGVVTIRLASPDVETFWPLTAAEFTTEGFGPRRVWVPPAVLGRKVGTWGLR